MVHTSAMLQLAVCVICAAAIGYLARSAGLCMVRGVAAARGRDPLPLLALLSCGFWVHLAALGSFAAGEGSPQLIHHPGHWRFFAGGLLFGIGAAANGGCAVGTIARGFAGDLRMAATGAGWLAGAAILAGTELVRSPPAAAPLAGQPWQGALAAALLVALLLAVRVGRPAAWKFWRAASAVGVLSLVLFLFEPGWDPSASVMKAADALLGLSPPPSARQAAIFAALGAGVLACSLQAGQFRIIVPSPAAAAAHLAAGTLMGVGLALALGGNDTQLLLRLPTLAASALLAMAGLLLGIWLFLDLRAAAGRPAAGFRSVAPIEVVGFLGTHPVDVEDAGRVDLVAQRGDIIEFPVVAAQLLPLELRIDRDRGLFADRVVFGLGIVGYDLLLFAHRRFLVLLARLALGRDSLLAGRGDGNRHLLAGLVDAVAAAQRFLDFVDVGSKGIDFRIKTLDFAGSCAHEVAAIGRRHLPEVVHRHAAGGQRGQHCRGGQAPASVSRLRAHARIIGCCCVKSLETTCPAGRKFNERGMPPVSWRAGGRGRACCRGLLGRQRRGGRVVPNSQTLADAIASQLAVSRAAGWPLTDLNAIVAHAQGYTGKRVTIGLIDSGVDIGHWELKDRIVNPESAGDARLSAGQTLGLSSHGTGTGGVIIGSTLAAPAALSVNVVYRTSLYGTLNGIGVIVGSTVSVAAGLSADLLARDTTGIAPDARLYVIPIPLRPPPAVTQPYKPISLIAIMGQDGIYAERFRKISQHVSIINNSFGYEGVITESIYPSSSITVFLRRTVETIAQKEVDDADKVLYVWSAGNSHGRRVVAGMVTTSLDASSPNLLAGLAYRVPRLTVNSVAVVALRPNGRIAAYSNRCGVAAHFCIAAPGGGRSLRERIWAPTASRDEDGKLRRGYGLTAGTSIAAPYVSGALAVLMEAFPSMGSTEILARMLATANKSGFYAQAAIYGAGMLDLEAALEPAGATSLLAGDDLEGPRFPAAASRLQSAPAFGDALANALRGASIVAYDDLDAPFAASLDSFLEPGDPARLQPAERGLARLAADAAGRSWRGGAHAFGPGPAGWFGLEARGRLPAGLPAGAFSLPHLSLLDADAIGAGFQTGRLRAAAFLAAGEDPPEAAAVVFEYQPALERGSRERSGWLLHAGALGESSRFLGSRARGAFGSLQARTVFAGVQAGQVLAGGWRAWAAAAAGLSRPVLASGILRRMEPAVTSSWALGISRTGLLRAGDSFALVASQPLRAESGRARLEVSVGRTRYRQVLSEAIEFDLQPFRPPDRSGACLRSTAGCVRAAGRRDQGSAAIPATAAWPGATFSCCWRPASISRASRLIPVRR